MKKTLLKLLFFAVVLLSLIQITSFTSAKVSQGATTTIVPEENALIGIEYDNLGNKVFSIINNTDQIIHIRRIEIDANGTAILSDDPYIFPSEQLSVPIIGAAADLYGQKMHVFVEWENGMAELISELPLFFEEESESIETNETTEE